MRRVLALGLLLGLEISCSGKKSSPAGPSYADRESFCHEWAARNCRPEVIDGCLAGGADACIASGETTCKAKVPDGKYSSAGAQDCLDAIDAAYADGKMSPEDRDLIVEFAGACSKVLSGSGSTGESCQSDSDCNREEDLACVRRAGHASGLCEKPAPVDNGGSCSAEDAVCGDGYYCDSGNHCVEGGGDAAPCSDAEPCTTGFLCQATPTNGGDGGVAGATCKALGQKGDPCETDDDCATRICVLVKADTYKCDDRIVPGSSICAAIQ
ncbi:MAG TPA: hypothetical protein VHE30_28255 [Polyangiaceae bacterium]|nr:hypothetical protein [Polyangiaceae bacterium]